MSDGYLDSIIQVVAPYQASYLPTPISDMPGSGCLLPNLTALPGALGSPELPGALKNCVPPFTPFPIIPAPYSIPENCPDGITFENTNVGIYAQSSDSEPTAVITVGVTQNDNFCSYSLDIPDIVIPCFPAGPQFNGSAIVTVSDPNAGTVKIGSISIAKSDEVACDWSLQGNISIDLPVVPCQSGITFQNATLPIYNQAGTLMASPLVSIASGGNPCLFEIEMPNLVIPCYPAGPSISGGVTIQTTDSANSTTTSTQSLTFASSILNPCSFTLSGPDIEIDIPCSSTGTGITFTDWAVTDPNTTITTNFPVAAATRLGNNPCDLNIALPSISIPCQTGIVFLDSTTISIGGTVLDSTHSIGYSNGTGGCTWNPINPVVDLPTLYCEGGTFTTGTSGFSVKVNGSAIPTSVSANSSYNTMTLALPAEGCGVDLTGTINLQIPCPGGIGTSSNSTLVISNPATGAATNISLEVSDCTIGFADPIIVLPGLLPCANPVAPTTSIAFLNADGSHNSSTLALRGSLCNLSLGGTIEFPGASGSGLSEWNPFGTGAGIIYAPSTEGGLDIYTPTPGQTPGPNDWPGSSKKWTHISSTQLRPYEVIKSDTEIPSNTANATDQGLLTTNTDCVVKVNPVSYLYSSGYNTSVDPTASRIPIFGLDMPFILRPGNMVYLEVVHAFLGSSTTPTALYGAICKGPAYDFNIYQTGTSNIAINGNGGLNLPFRTLTKQTLLSANSGFTSSSTLTPTDGSGISNFIVASLTNYVGINTSSTLYTDLFNIQAYCLKQIMAVASSTGTTSTPWQFKTYEVIAYGENPSPNSPSPSASSSDPYPAIPRKTGGLQLSYIDNSGNTTYFTVKQSITYHQGITIGSSGTSANIPVYILKNFNNTRGVLPFLQNASGNFVQPECHVTTTTTGSNTITRIGTDSIPGFDTGNVASTNTSTLLSNLAKTLGGLGVTTAAFTSATNPQPGNGPLDLKIYLTTDGSPPSINTILNQGCQRYEGIEIDMNATTTAPTKRITWVSVFPEYAIGNPASISADYTNPDSITWGNTVNV